jgi:hypothetical protein
MMVNTKTLALALAVALIGPSSARAITPPKWMSDLDFMKGSWVQDGSGRSTLTVASVTTPTSLIIKHRTTNAGAVGGRLVDATSELHIYQRDGRLQADEQADDTPRPLIQSHFTTVSIVPHKSVMLTMTTNMTVGDGVELSYWVCEWDPKKLCLSYAIKRANLMPITLMTAVLMKHLPPARS